jgi:hypothetical protein
VFEQNVPAVSGVGAYYTAEFLPDGYNFVRIFRNIVGIGFDVDLTNRTFANKQAEWANPTITLLPDGWIRVEAEYIGTRPNNGYSIQPMPSAFTQTTFAGDGVSGVRVRKPQVELGAFTNYQKVTSTFDVTEAGQPDNFFLADTGAKQLPWTATAGDYTVAFIDTGGAVTILENQAISGATEILQSARTGSYVAVDRLLTQAEKDKLTTYLEGKGGGL